MVVKSNFYVNLFIDATTCIAKLLNVPPLPMFF